MEKESFITNLKEQVQEQPLMALTVGMGVAATVTSFLKVLSDIYGRRTWSKEVKRRSKLS